MCIKPIKAVSCYLFVLSVTNNTESNYQQDHHHTLQILHPNCEYFHNLSNKFGKNVPNCRNTNGKTMKKEHFVLPSLMKLMLLKCQVYIVDEKWLKSIKFYNSKYMNLTFPKKLENIT